ncbi:MAG: hypothetical protein PHV07_01615 [Oscillospiraceae bacterium]|nr:hypothetical protein [Oscillospiraceae bacterium]
MARYKFYNSRRWRRVREFIINRAGGMCELCGDRGSVAHHKVEVNDENVNNPNIVWGIDNLICVCVLCHERIHHGKAEVCREGLMFDKDGNLVEAPHLFSE